MAGSLITDRVKQIVRMRGPVIPSQISKEIGTNILMASAILSELSSTGEVKISSVKFGGTPLYYVPGQEPKLQNYLTSLPQKEREAFEQLKTSGVLADTSQDPATRFALRQLKDFAKPLEVGIDGESYLFWKWYLLTNEAAEVHIKKIMGIAEEQAPKQQPPEQPAMAATSVIKPVIGTQPQTPLQQASSQSVLQTIAQPQLQPQHAEKTRPVASATAQQPLQPAPVMKKQPAINSAALATEFAKAINDFFEKNDIEIESTANATRSELEHIVLLPSPVGKLRYYCIAKNKKTCTDTDISSAMINGQLNKLPVLLLTKGDLSKKAQELLSKEIGAIVVKKI